MLSAAVIVVFAVIRKPIDLGIIRQTQAMASESSTLLTFAAPNGIPDYHLSGTGELVPFNAMGIMMAVVVFALGVVAAYYLGKEKKTKES